MSCQRCFVFGVMAVCAFISSTAGSPQKFIGTDTKNVTCVMLQANVALDITYQDDQNATQQFSKQLLSNETHSSGVCGNDTDQLVVSSLHGDDTFSLNFTFIKVKDNYKLGNVSVVATIGADNASSAVNVSSTWSTSNFTTELDTAYNCSASRKLSHGNVTISLSSVTVQAFENYKGANTTGLKFSKTGTDCNPSSSVTDAIVPIAVGAALAGMVLIVLVGYCIGRRRTRAGYQNMSTA